MKITSDQFRIAPELGLLAAIDRALELAGPALAAAHPEIWRPIGFDDDLPPSCELAPQLTDLIAQLREMLELYHTAIADELTSPADFDPDLPF